ncbi:MAG: nodulation protein NfeD [Chloroflexota bacterium]
MKYLRVLLLSLVCFMLFSQVFAQSDKPLVLVMTADGPIEPAMLEYFKRGIGTAEQRNAEVLVIQLNTPGGDLQSMLEIVTAIRSSTVPVVIYVAPRGALAASAGAMITMAGQASAMAPETAIGAVIPINGSGQNLDSDLRTKQMNVLKDKIHPFVAPRGDPAVKLANSMIEEGKSADVNKALEAKLIDFPANDIKDLLNKLNGFTIQMSTGPRTLHTANAQTEPLNISFIERLLLLLTDSNIAFLLLAIGVQAIIIEISHPGGWAAGFVGVVCLSLAIYGMGVLPINWFGIVFLITAFVLFILDIKAPTHGALTAAGVVSFIVGALVLFNSPGTPQFQRVSVPLVISVGIFIGLMFFGILLLALRTIHSPVIMGVEAMLGKTGTAKTWAEAEGQVQMQSELWSAEAVAESEKISKGDQVEVVQVEGLRLKVKKK